MKSRILGALAVILGMALLPTTSMAATQQTGTQNLSLTAGTLSVGAVSTTTLNSTAITAGSVATGVNTAVWTDTTGSGTGWNGTIAMQQFHVSGTGVWSIGTSHALANINSGQYTGANTDAAYTVTVTADTGSGGNITFAYSGEESGTVGPVAKTSAISFGSDGMTIQFVPATTYTGADVYTAQVGNLATSAVNLTVASGTVTVNGTTKGGTNLPAFTNDTQTVTGGTTSTFGSALKFITAAKHAGVGAFNVTPGVTITWDPNNTWASPTQYTANAQYTIATGP